MPQLQLPIFGAGTTLINGELAFEERDGQVVYFNGHLPVFTHGADDVASFRFFTTQLIVNGTASQVQISRAFGVPLVTVKRCVKKLREEGGKAFFAPRPRRCGSKLTPERLLAAQEMLNQGKTVPFVSSEIGVLATTLHKALDDGRLQRAKKKMTTPRESE